MTTKSEQGHPIERVLRTVFGSLLLTTVLASAIAAAFGFVISSLGVNVVLGAMFGIWGATGVILGSGAYLLVRLYRSRSEHDAEAGRELFSQ